jgi:hypothetical protein
MSLIVGLRDRFLPERREVLERAFEVYSETGSWKAVEDYVRKEFRRDVSFWSFNLFTYFLLVGGSLLLPLLFLWKVACPPGTLPHFLSRLFFMLSAMFTLKGIVGHYVVVFLNQDRFNAELKALRETIEGGRHGKRRN